MYSRKINAQIEHDGLVRMLVEHYKKLNYSRITADLSGYERPTLIRGTLLDHIPDVACVKNAFPPVTIIAEAETGESLRDEHTISQLQLFRSAATKLAGEFHLVVPAVINGQPGRAVAANWLQHLGISADEIWVPRT